MTDLTKLTIAQLRDGFQAKEFTSVEATQAYVDAVLRWQKRYADQARVWRVDTRPRATTGHRETIEQRRLRLRSTLDDFAAGRLGGERRS